MSSEFEIESGEVSGWVGWIIFAAIMMIVAGALSVIEGLGALLRDESYFIATGGGRSALLTFNLTTWGWIHLIIGIVLLIAGILMIRGSVIGAVAGGIIVAINLIAQFAWLGAYPWWSITIIAIDVLILYALFVHGDEIAGT